jgi:hypothetical protein
MGSAVPSEMLDSGGLAYSIFTLIGKIRSSFITDGS